MSDRHEKLSAAMRECAAHAEILREDLGEHGDRRYGPEDVPAQSRDQTRLLDQIAYRFGKLQDSMGEKVLPLMLELAEEPIAPSAPFAQKLTRLEKIGVIPSADTWRGLRQIRYSIAHEYPEHPEIKAAVLNRFVRSVADLVAFWEHVRRAADRLVAER